MHPVARRALTWYRAVRDERTRRALPFGPPALNPEARGAMAGVLAPRKDELEGLLRAIRTARDSLNPYDAYLCGQLRRCPVPSPAWGQLTNENLAFFSGRRAGLLLLRQWLGAVMRATRAQLQLVDHVERMAGNDGAQLLKRGLDQRQEERQQALEERVAYSRQQLLYACELWDQHRGGALEERAGAAERQAEAQRPLAMECPVCFEEDVTEWQMLPCLHMFCLQCCETLLRHSRLCPQCRRRFQVRGDGVERRRVVMVMVMVMVVVVVVAAAVEGDDNSAPFRGQRLRPRCSPPFSLPPPPKGTDNGQ